MPCVINALTLIRESSHGTKEFFNLPPLVLKARHLNGSAFCLIDIGLPEQAVGGFPLGLGLVVEDRPTEFSCLFADRELASSPDPPSFSMPCETLKSWEGLGTRLELGGWEEGDDGLG